MRIKKLRKKVRENIIEEQDAVGEKYISIPHGDIKLTFNNPKDAKMMIIILKAFNYISEDDMIALFGGSGETREEILIGAEQAIKDGLMLRYTINGTQFFTLNSDKKDRIKEIIDEE